MRLSLLVIVGQLNLIYLLLGVDFSLKRGFKEILRRDIKDKSSRGDNLAIIKTGYDF